MRKIQKYRVQSGIGLLELMLSLAIISLLLVMATTFWSITNRSEQFNAATQELGIMLAGLQSWKGDQATYQGLTFNSLYESGGVPESIQSNGQLPSQDGCIGRVNANPSAKGYATLSFSGISNKVCGALAKRMSSKSNSMIYSAYCHHADRCGARFNIVVR